MLRLSDSVRIAILQILRFAVDVGIAAASFHLSYMLIMASRDILWIPGVADKTLGFTLIAAISLYVCGVGRGSWRHVSIPDLLVLVKASLVSVAAYLLAAFLVSRGANVPRSVPVLTFIFMILGMSGVRLIYRLAVEGSWLDMFGIRPITGKNKVLLYGFTDQAEGYIRMTSRMANSDTSILGVIDDDRMNRTRTIQGAPVLGPARKLEEIVKRQAELRVTVTEIVVTTANPEWQELTDLVERANALGLRVSRIPDVTETSTVESELIFQPKPIELGDLLGRPEVSADLGNVARLVHNRSVLVTGAGGSIGSELCRQIAAVNPKVLVITDASEYLLYLLDGELREKFPQINIITRLANVRDAGRVRSLMEELRPETVFHAAALKHVPMVERNPLEAVKTNVLGTRNVANAALHYGVANFVVISTDKAVNPTNIMGATKRAAEAYCQSLDVSSTTTQFKTVRFGNVLGSNGSVVPLFQSQIAKGGPVTVTHPHVVRYFMTIPEAVRLVLHAASSPNSAETGRGKIMVLDMGKPVRIADLAERMIQLAGFKPHKEIEIVFTGLRPGEKLYEELFDPSEMQAEKTRDGYFIAAPRIIDPALLQRSFEGLEKAVEREDARRAIELISHIVPEYRPVAEPYSVAIDTASDSFEAQSSTYLGEPQDDWR